MAGGSGAGAGSGGGLVSGSISISSTSGSGGGGMGASVNPILPSLYAEVDSNTLASDETCSICLDGFADPGMGKALLLNDCVGHWFHLDCISRQFEHRPHCPNCQKSYGTMKGDMPDGVMSWNIYPAGSHPLEGE